MSKLTHLFSPIKIGRMEVKNRLLMPGMSINFGVDSNGFVTDQLTEYFAARAKGGTGMLIVGGGGVDTVGHELPNLPALWDDDCVPALKKMTKKVKSFGARFGMQIMHGGRQTYKPNKVAPSPIPALALVKGTPRELTTDDIKEVVNAFGDSARRCKEGGFDFIEIHAAHGYLINQFMAPNSNMREDEYGGSFENRIRFMLEVFRNIKMKTDDDFPVGIRLNGEDYAKDGFMLEEAIKLASVLEKEGADYLHVSAGIYGSTQLTIPSMYVPQGCFVHLAEAVKKNVSIPVITVGRIKDPEYADRIIKEGKADIVAMGRAHIAEPDIAKKAEKGDLASIRPCLGCCLGCFQSIMNLEPATCVVNPQVGREYLVKKAEKVSNPKKILIIGSGPAGLSAARSAALKGHNILILEEKGYIGGIAKLAAKVPGRSDIMDIINFFTNELAKLNVEIRINTRINQKIIETIKPDDVIIASGSLPDMPLIKGLSNTEMNLCTAVEILEKSTVVNDKAVILGGNQAGLVLADYLAEKGKKVVVLNRKDHFAEEMAANDRFYLRERLKKNNVKLYKKVSVKEILSDGVIFTHNKKEEKLTGFDSIILSEKMEPIRETKKLFKKSDIGLHIIGDANLPRNIMFAIAEGEEAGSSI
jgi:2,4-dienoyl-CoA reductase-like NADH-dependent reductase (Old Yellow Enzyme family)/thioredoxin reductase